MLKNRISIIMSICNGIDVNKYSVVVNYRRNGTGLVAV